MARAVKLWGSQFIDALMVGSGGSVGAYLLYKEYFFLLISATSIKASSHSQGEGKARREESRKKN